MRSEAAWSYLDVRPVCMYDPTYDAHLVFWNGVSITRSYALLIYGRIWCNIYCTESQKLAAWNEYTRIYRSGGFATTDWDGILNSYDHRNFIDILIRFIVSKDGSFFLKLKEKYTEKEALTWFMPSREIIDKHTHS